MSLFFGTRTCFLVRGTAFLVHDIMILVHQSSRDPIPELDLDSRPTRSIIKVVSMDGVIVVSILS